MTSVQLPGGINCTVNCNSISVQRCAQLPAINYSAEELADLMPGVCGQLVVRGLIGLHVVQFPKLPIAPVWDTAWWLHGGRRGRVRCVLSA